MSNRYIQSIRCSIKLCLMLCISFTVRAQVNYVLNPSFEQYSRCPYELDQIKFTKYWTAIDTLSYPPLDSFGNGSCTPEYCNTCSTYGGVAVPYNDLFYHYPRTGNGLARVLMFYDESTPSSYLRDYLQGKLFQTLVAGKSYCITFFVALQQQSNYAVNHIGAYLDNGIIDTTQHCGSPQTTHVPQVSAVNVIKDTLNWTKIEGSFIANGTEKFITIGNFYDKAHTTYIVANPNALDQYYGGYIIDDVSVVESDIPAYAGGKFFKTKKDSVFIGRNEIIPDCEWYQNGILIDTVHAGFWVKDTVNTTYVVKQSICGNVKYDTAWIIIENVGVGNISGESVYRIYPNPALHELTLQAPNNTSTATVNICDMSGRVMMKQQVDFVNGEVRLPLNLGSGLYVVELVDANGGRSLLRLSVVN